MVDVTHTEKKILNVDQLSVTEEMVSKWEVKKHR
jgi:hypothetical protein